MDNNNNFRIFAGTAHLEFAKEIASILNHDLSEITLKRFACGEIFVNLEDSVRGKDVFIINTARGGLVNDDFMETFLMCDAAKRSFARRVHLVFPHFGYARQDKIHKARETIAGKLMANLLVKSGIDHLITLHLHADQVQAFFDVPVDNLSIRRLFVERLKTENIKDPIIVSPDAGGAKYAKKVADLYGADLAILHKNRPDHNMAEVVNIIGDVEGKTVILVDDMVDTAGSMCAAKEALIKKGANEDVYFVATHPIFSDPAVSRLKKANFKKIFVSNSMPLSKEASKLNVEVVSVAPLIANVLENVMLNKPVSGLFF